MSTQSPINQNPSLSLDSKSHQEHQQHQESVEQLLDRIVNINEENQTKILEILKTAPKEIILTRANASVRNSSLEFPRTSSFLKFIGRIKKQITNEVYRAEFNQVTPLEAAASCADLFSVYVLCHALPDELKYQAGQQLEQLMKSEGFLLELRNLLESGYGKYMSAFGHVVGYRPPTDHLSYDDRVRMDAMWEGIGEYQKNLSNAALQYFCKRERSYPSIDFSLESNPKAREVQLQKLPENRTIRLKWNRELDLSSIGKGTHSALFKLSHEGAILKSCEYGKWAHDGDRVYYAYGFQDEVGNGMRAFYDNVVKCLSKLTSDLLTYSFKKKPELSLPPVRFHPCRITKMSKDVAALEKKEKAEKMTVLDQGKCAPDPGTRGISKTEAEEEVVVLPSRVIKSRMIKKS